MIMIKSFYYNSLDSTMDEAKRLIKAGKIKETSFVVANNQSRGRGTHGRNWSSPERAGIYLSVIHLPKKEKYLQTTSLYTFSAGIACVEAIQNITGIKTFIKPINDIYFQSQKLGGILIESELTSYGINWLITGVGINTHNASRNTDQSTIAPISIQEILPLQDFQNFSTQLLTEALVSKTCFWHSKVFDGKYKEVEQQWQDYKLIE